MINLNSKENIKNMKKIYSFLISFLLAILALTPLVTKSGENLDTIYADGENQITVSSVSELRDIATKVNSGEDTYSGKTIRFYLGQRSSLPGSSGKLLCGSA